MIETIHKHPIPLGERFFTIEMPIRSKILGVQVQNGAPVMWILHDFVFALMERQFLVLTTGEPIPSNLSAFHRHYVGTLQLDSGGYVIHIFINEKESK